MMRRQVTDRAPEQVPVVLAGSAASETVPAEHTGLDPSAPEMEHIMNSILRAVTGMISSVICLEICLAAKEELAALALAVPGFHGFGGGNGFSGSGFSDRGNDLNAEVQITFDEAVHGCEKTITIQNPNQPGSRPQTLKVKIPAGIETGKSIRLAGKGMPGTGGGAAGDLLLKITVGEKPGWTRKGMDVYSDVEVPFTTAVFGGETLVHTLYGDVVCKIKAGTRSGTKIRLRGKGIVSLKDPSLHGDQYAVVRIQVPDDLSPEAKQKLKEFEEICRRDGRFHAA